MDDCMHTNGLTLVFENGSELGFGWPQVNRMLLSHTYEDLMLVDDGIAHINALEGALIEIDEAANEEYMEFGQFPSGISVFDHISKSEISQIVVGTMESETTYHVEPGRETGSYRDNRNLVIKIS